MELQSTFQPSANNMDASRPKTHPDSTFVKLGTNHEPRKSEIGAPPKSPAARHVLTYYIPAPAPKENIHSAGTAENKTIAAAKR